MKISWVALAVTAAVCIPVSLVVVAVIPDLFRSDNLFFEAARPLAMTALFCVLAGYAASRADRTVWSGALGGAIMALLNLGLILLVASTLDRHFVAIGGRSLIPWFPVTVPVGALLGMLGVGVRAFRSAR